MPIPQLEPTGLLPRGVHNCTIAEIEGSFGWNNHREELLNQFKNCLFAEIRPLFPDPLYFDGSFITDKEIPDDVDVVLDLVNSPDARKWQGLKFMRDHQTRLMQDYRVHFWVNLPSGNDFCRFFQSLCLHHLLKTCDKGIIEVEVPFRVPKTPSDL